MTTIKVEKYAAGTLIQAFTVPGFAVQTLEKCLPESAVRALAARHIDLQAIVQAKQQGQPYRAELQVREEGVEKTVVITVE